MSNLNELTQRLQTRLRRGLDGEAVIEGKRGNVHEDGVGFSLYAGFVSGKGLRRCKDAFAGFAQLCQEGDTEGVWHLPKLPTQEQAAVIRYLLGLPKRRHVPPERANRLLAWRFTRHPAHVQRPDSTISTQPGQDAF